MAMTTSFPRRSFLAGISAGMGLPFLLGRRSALADQIEAAGKRVLFLFQHGGLSQLESWDPKPRTEFGGPFGQISTSVPGLNVSELLPNTAQQMHHLAVLRGMSTEDANHDSARVRMITGWSQGFVGGQHPSFGAVCGKLLGSETAAVPAYVKLTDRAHWHLASLVDASFLGPKYAPVVAFDEQPPDYLVRPPALSEDRAARINSLRERLNQRLSPGRRSAETAAYEQSYDKARQLMQQQAMFDLTQESAQDHERYGSHAFGQRCLLARRLLEHGVTFVKLNHINYDAHFENFDNHLRLLGEFDRPFAMLMEDLAQRGMLESTLVVVMGEFGRTPKVNSSIGRDHWATAWSIALGGCGIKPGVVFGRTNDTGTGVADGQVKAFDLFHTFYTALGLDPHEHIYNGDQPLTLTDAGGTVIKDILK
jgi:uncharacterized protein (DUF1501 family)